MATYIALLHYPVYNRQRQIVATSVANMDIHDISRAAKTYGIERFFIITPIQEQLELVDKILNHWKSGYGATFNPSRKEAFDTTETKANLEDATKSIESHNMKLVATGAGLKGPVITHKDLRESIRSGHDDYLVLFGTGSGLSDEIINRADYRLEPIMGPFPYNHLSVRSAAAITLDRLFGQTSL